MQQETMPQSSTKKQNDQTFVSLLCNFVSFLKRKAEDIVYGEKHAALMMVPVASEQIQTETGIICGDVSILLEVLML